MAHPTRTGDVVAFSYPPYQFDAATPGTLVSLSHFFGQHGYVPDVQDLADNVNMRATFIAGGEGIMRRNAAGAVDRHRPDAGVPDAHPGAAAQPGAGDAADRRQQPVGHVRWASSGSTTSTASSTRPPGSSTTPSTPPSAAPGSWRRCSTRRRRTLLGRDQDPGRRRQRRGVPTQLGAAPRRARHRRGERLAAGRHQLRQPRVRLRARTAADAPGERRLPVPRHQHRRDGHRRAARLGAGHGHVVRVNGVRVGVIGSALETTPELVSAGATEGLTFLPSAPAIEAASEALQAQGINVQIVVIHEGTAVGVQCRRRHRRGRPGRGRSSTSPAS